ncbi:hypothetical protein AR158_C110R [Paramecium bursaria Chlorella virus AR158]|uniref:hypothetical protein n=1 Tax=Paramecium bursaria Chlorella virus AR158 TaxID=380598 RepID=UPI00015AA7B4|nr:hypothetical protein AR158_C110R [Paramecium bursaria Chlorella virus AR158]ABU43656.1 hypothetical protein AR158_C110R [Paramecium bursaria Chlorella virus AR158]
MNFKTCLIVFYLVLQPENHHLVDESISWILNRGTYSDYEQMVTQLSFISHIDKFHLNMICKCHMISMNDLDTYKTTFYMCGCGYKTLNNGSASKHKKTSCGHEMTHETKIFLLQEDVMTQQRLSDDAYSKILENDIKNLEIDIKKLENDIKNLETNNKKLETENKKLKNLLINKELDTCDVDSDDYFPGLVYYINDKELLTRGKIGRTADMNIKKLKSRYSIFGNPLIVCFVSTNIKADEKKLKNAMKAAGCMNDERGKESIHHSDEAMTVFHRVAIQCQ